jgi:hypothetical protein
MAYNLFIAYDLRQPIQNYEQVRAAIESLGKYYQFQQSLYYLHTNHSPSEVFGAVGQFMDANDKLVVINAQSGIVSTGDRPPIDAINAIWHLPD